MTTDLNNLILLFVTLFVIAIILAIIVRIILLIILKLFTKKHIDAQKLSEEIAKKSQAKKDEDLYRNKLQEQQKYNKIEKEANQEMDEVEIVDIVKPVGFWTSMILGQKLTSLISSAKIMNKDRKKGFWASMVEAQQRSKGRYGGR
jgi:hypothetical protein